ncbi:MAG: SDR family oxidoreductase [Pseudohongiella sp.]|uniref:SDR family oxidoreductase n=1 Tax=Pseudohongiella sp. TaxID=1979412 RepID=UPI0034A03F52
MNYLVTGGAGFIGSHIAAYLCSQGQSVRVLDNFSSGKRENLSGLDLTVIEGDIRDPACVSAAVEGVDTIFHQAALCSVARSMMEPALTHDINVTGTMNLLEAARKADVRRFVMASSSAVYGDSEVFPKHESMPTDPMSPYAVSKLVCEHYCQLYYKAYGLDTVALRYFNVFGPRQNPDSEYSAVIPRFVRAMVQGVPPHIYGDGSQSRDFTYVNDIVQANIAAATSSDARGQVMNIACGNRWSLLDLVSRLENHITCDADPIFEKARAGDVKHSQACIKKAQKLIAFAPEVDFDEGLRRTVDWFATQHHIPEIRLAV